MPACAPAPAPPPARKRRRRSPRPITTLLLTACTSSAAINGVPRPRPRAWWAGRCISTAAAAACTSASAASRAPAIIPALPLGALQPRHPIWMPVSSRVINYHVAQFEHKVHRPAAASGGGLVGRNPTAPQAPIRPPPRPQPAQAAPGAAANGGCTVAATTSTCSAVATRQHSPAACVRAGALPGAHIHAQAGNGAVLETNPSQGRQRRLDCACINRRATCANDWITSSIDHRAEHHLQVSAALHEGWLGTSREHQQHQRQHQTAGAPPPGCSQWFEIRAGRSASRPVTITARAAASQAVAGASARQSDEPAAGRFRWQRPGFRSGSRA